MQMFLEVGPGREGQKEHTGTTLGSNASYGCPSNSWQGTGAHSAAGLGLSQFAVFCHAWAQCQEKMEAWPIDPS